MLYAGFVDGAEWADAHPRWISVDDELPPNKERVLVFYGIDRYIGLAMLEDVIGQQTFWNDGRKPVFHITHWMPMPAQPILSNVEKIGKDVPLPAMPKKGGEE